MTKELHETARSAADVVWARLVELRTAFLQLDLLPALELVVAVAGGEQGCTATANLLP